MKPQIVKGDTQLIGLLGNPVAHSLSPLIHNHLFASLDLPYVYVPLAVEKENIAAAVKALSVFPFRGANVTIPYKSAVIPYCDTIDGLSCLSGTVNTLYFKEKKLCGTTTDAQGFFMALESTGSFIENDHIVILGNGGTARTLAFAFVTQKDIASLTIVGRNSQKVEALALQVNKKTGARIHSTTFDSAVFKEALASCTLLVNCTSVGMAPHHTVSPVPSDCFHPKMTVFDAIYNPAQTVFLQYAQKAGCKTQNGLRMLLFQALASFTYWTGVKADDKIINLHELQSMVLL